MSNRTSGNAAAFRLGKDAFFRAHVVEIDAKPPLESSYAEPPWPEFVLLFDTETTLDPKEQALLFGFYRVCRLREGIYQSVEEGIVHADDLVPENLSVIRRYVTAFGSEVLDDDCDEAIHIYSRSEFVERVFFQAVKTRSMIVAFNAPWDISRLSIGRKTGRGRAWTLIMSQRISSKTGEVEANPERPCIRVTSKDSKAAFFSLTKPMRPEEWPTYQVGDKTRMIFRVLDVRTLGWALYNESYSLKRACKELKTEHQKFDHEPTGMVTTEELEYGRQDVRCTTDVLNVLKAEFDRHPISSELHPDKAVSPASIGKSYLRAMGIRPPKEKFAVSDYIHGIASQAYFGGRAEARIRNTPMPVVLTDFSSQYPTINALQGNWDILTAESLSFEDATDEIQRLLQRSELPDTFDPAFWKELRFFALVYPDGDILPVRAEYSDDGVTKNIGMNHFTSAEPIWLSGPDVIASKLLTGRTPIIEKAIRLVPHGKQKGLRPTNLRRMVKVDPSQDDLFRVMVEQRQLYKDFDKALAFFLKIVANAASYGMFFELTPKKKTKPVKVRVFAGEHEHEQPASVIEQPGEWYFPPIAALITGGAHLLLAMLECCIAEKDGQYLFCDTDSMCIVATKDGGPVACPNEPEIKALSWPEVESIAKRFESLNCYDQTKVRGSILKIEKVNFENKKQVELFGYAISAKRYTLYRYDSAGNIVIVDAKAHGLGYLFPPRDYVADDTGDDWVFEAWHWVLEGEIASPRRAPDWLVFPAMMQMTVSTPAILGILKDFTRPFNFLNMPLLFSTSYPKGKDPSTFSLMMPFSKNRSQWLSTKAFDTHTGKAYSISLLKPKGRTTAIEVKCYGNVLGAYREHPESKFLGHEGKPCEATTRGLLRRSHIIAKDHRYIGKETSRRWEQGDDASLIDFRCAEYCEGRLVANEALIQIIKKHGIRKTARLAHVDSKTVMLIVQRQAVKPSTLAAVVKVFSAQA